MAAEHTTGLSTGLTTGFTLRRPTPAPATAPELDPSQQAVLDHGRTPGAGPLLVLAGPGTGKTTTLVELVADRLASGAVSADQVLMLTFSRKAAEEMKGRVAARAGAHVAAMTFHSWCYALVRSHSNPEDFASPPTLITAPEQESMVADLLGGQDPKSWPEDLRQAVRTRGFARELVTFMEAASDAEPGVLESRPDWARAGQAIEEYGSVADAQNVVDYPTLITRASVLLGDHTVAAEVGGQYRLIVVDEFQDTDPAQLELLRRLINPGHEFIAVGDHDQSIYAFRGASVDGVTRFTEWFGTDEHPAKVVALRRTRRFGAAIRDAAVSVLGGHAAGTIDPQILREHRQLECVPAHDPDDPGTVDVLTFTSPTAEAEHIAHLIRRRHFEEGLAWSDFSILVRTSADLSRFQRLLVDSDVPTEVAGDEIPLASEPAVRVLLGALETAWDLAHEREVSPEQATTLLSGPLAAIEAPALRVMARSLRAADRETPSPVLLARALADPDAWPDSRAARLARVLRDAANMIRDRQSPEQVLWHVWAGTDWPRVLRARWDRGGQERAAADRDLDALTSLFHDAARAEERHQRRDVLGYLLDLRSQELPADQLVGSALSSDAVHLMTAHRAKGLQWRHVFVAGVQDEIWPDLRFRPSLLRPDLLAGVSQTVAATMAEERRLFYVALTRARQRVTVTAVDDPGDEGSNPSRFVTDLRQKLGAESGSDATTLSCPVKPLSLRHIVASARAIGESHDATDEQRQQAAAVLARLAVEGVRAADPNTWWGARELTHSDQPLFPAEQPIPLSGSALTTINNCALRWFLERKARGEVASTTSQGFGLIVHAIAEHVVKAGIDDPDPAELHAIADGVWSRLGHESPWRSEREKEAAHEALTRFARWHSAHGRRVIDAEKEFRVELEVAGDRVVLRGSMDRVEVDSNGAIHVVDFKTSTSAPRKADIEGHLQLAVYQRAVSLGAADETGTGERRTVGGSELVQLRQHASTKDPEFPKVQQQPVLPEPSFLDDALEHAATVLRHETIMATPVDCSYCSFVNVCPTKVPVTIGAHDE